MADDLKISKLDAYVIVRAFSGAALAIAKLDAYVIVRPIARRRARTTAQIVPPPGVTTP